MLSLVWRGCSPEWDLTLHCDTLCWIWHFRPLEKSLKWAQISVLSPGFGWPGKVQIFATVFWSWVCGVLGISFSQLAFPCFSSSLPWKKAIKLLSQLPVSTTGILSFGQRFYREVCMQITSLAFKNKVCSSSWQYRVWHFILKKLEKVPYFFK